MAPPRLRIACSRPAPGAIRLQVLRSSAAGEIVEQSFVFRRDAVAQRLPPRRPAAQPAGAVYVPPARLAARDLVPAWVREALAEGFRPASIIELVLIGIGCSGIVAGAMALAAI